MSALTTVLTFWLEWKLFGNNTVASRLRGNKPQKINSTFVTATKSISARTNLQNRGGKDSKIAVERFANSGAHKVVFKY